MKKILFGIFAISVFGNVVFASATAEENEKNIEKTVEAIMFIGDELNKKIENNNKSIDSLYKETKGIKENKTTIDDHEARISENEGEIKYLNDANELRKRDIITNENRINLIEDFVNINRNSLNEHDDKINRLIDNSIQHKESEDRISKNEINIKYLNKNMSTINEGLAEVAALSGLLQPITAGKGIVSAAIGGHNKSFAFAVGGGYKFNNGIGIKGAVSTSKFKGASYNLGIGYEF